MGKPIIKLQLEGNQRPWNRLKNGGSHGDMMGTVGVDVDMADIAKTSALFLARTHKTQNTGIQIWGFLKMELPQVTMAFNTKVV